MARVEPLHSFIYLTLRSREPLTYFARTLARRAERRLAELATEVNVRRVLMRYINRYRTACTPRPAEDSDAQRANIIREVSKAIWLPASRTRSKETTPVALSFHDSHQLTCAAALNARSNCRFR